MVEITGTNKAGMGMQVAVGARPGRGEVNRPEGRAGAGVLAVATAGTAKQVKILVTTFMSPDLVIKSTLGTLKLLSLKLAGSRRPQSCTILIPASRVGLDL